MKKGQVMYRAISCFSIFLIILGIFGLAVPQSLSTLTFFLPHGFFAIAALCLGLFLLYFSVGGYLRKQRFKIWLGAMGLMLSIIALIGINNPFYFGLLKDYIHPTDTLILVLAGIGLLTAALEPYRPSPIGELEMPDSLASVASKLLSSAPTKLKADAKLKQKHFS